MTNISKIRQWNKTTEGRSDYYFTYKISKKDRGQFLNTWFKGNQFELNSIIYTDQMITLKKCDKHTSINLYNEEYNPLSISILLNHTIPLKYQKGEKSYNMKVQIHSIDDSSYSIWFEDKKYNELVELRNQLMNWVSNKSIISGKDLLDYSIELGADSDTIDYD